MQKKKFFVTTPIYYVNDIPHLGHAYCTIAADVVARFYRLKNFDVLFSTGTDEHGQKIEKTASQKNISPKELVDAVSPRFAELWQKLNISEHVFIRTTDKKHIETVNAFFKKVYQKGDIYLGHYQGLYCRPCETYWTETQAKDKKCPECNRELELLQEESFFFKLSNYSDQLLKHIENNPNFILPQARKNEVLNLIKDGLPDLSISRVTSKWGIAVPKEINDKYSQKNHFIYVWFDALLNYLTVSQELENKKDSRWPAQLHLVGKDIVKFHAITWPIMLMSAGFELPKMIYGHGFLTVAGEKMSKSKGNALSIEPLLEEFGDDALRYLILREVPFGSDGNVSLTSLYNRYNADLANSLGNLLSRTVAMTKKYFLDFSPSVELEEIKDQEILKILNNKLFLEIEKLFLVLDFNRILDLIWQFIAELNRIIELKKPWQLAKEAKNKELEIVIFTLIKSIFEVAKLISPFLPKTASKISEILNQNLASDFVLGQKINENQMLFPRKEYIAD